MTNLIDRIYFEELSGQNPIEVCRRALCSYDDIDKFYSISVWGKLYKIYPHQFLIKYITKTKHERLHPYFDLFVIHYLLKAKEIEPGNQWISEKDIPGGSTFFRGPHEIPTNLITAQFDCNSEGFKKRCEHYMGTPLNLADAAFVFKIVPRVPVAVLYWGGDDEFPTESKILYDKTIADHLALDIIYALAVGICERLGRQLNLTLMGRGRNPEIDLTSLDKKLS
jgi:hypothetical protein